ncbi:valine--tRNA ligase [Blochmannia endosymbiont of Camponotus (Colobopsis) obliquus]|uniref:valine--tRNA ligase n=1 Tax=Blochmannia endosymbiont of Camponotus (Colobopsis) obliquus TaxID=1505597 RepID=UPI00061A610E|nr:valine--tRNA ligase [Blochmannia endosymbiont of Camponotus (Colobopsis) obliquus]AKC60217.1 valine--tRNA ligase [Blochmannia endosymbiont of Camponotus (Colobopsis) obliquus]
MKKNNSTVNSTYNPKHIEQFFYNLWEKKNLFTFDSSTAQKNNFCIMMPPPNMTGTLHLGHAFQYSIMDTLVRYQRMLGKNTLWQTGIDHAGIATEIIMERKILLEEGKNRHEYNKEKFIKKIWEWKKTSTNIINNQMRRLGISVDWTRERFTMDDHMSHAVQEVFIRLYQKNLIYRDKRLVNWDNKLQTVISDLEVENKQVKGCMWYLRYTLADGIQTINKSNYLVVATTRPETIFGDVAIAINPMDHRYNNLIGKFVILPIINHRIPIIADKKIDLQQGTGCVKITPAHDFNDYTIAKNHKLPLINIFTYDGHICNKAKIIKNFQNTKNISYRYIPTSFQNLEKNIARKEIIKELDRLKLLQKTQEHILTIPYGARSGIILEPMLTNQWYLSTKPLAKQAIQAVVNGDIHFVSKKYEKMYFHWMHNIQDWCISRQIWWGHPIPVWYDNHGKIYVGHNEEEIRNKNQLSKKIILNKESSVLDTWFSSSIWTFAALGWPNDNLVLRTCHPTDIIISGFDIIFFWIARMIMLTMHILQDNNGKPQIPFKTIFITGLVRDEQGKKMSKSKGNTIDPVDIIDGISINDLIKKRIKHLLQPKLSEKIKKATKKQFPNGIKSYGTDALRFTMLSLSSSGRDIIWDTQRLEGYRNFCNKIWNASLFIIANTENHECGIFNDNIKIFSLVDKWIFTKFHQTIKLFQKQLNQYRFDLAANTLHAFIWHQFCNWYLEFAKTIINKKEHSVLELCSTRYTLIIILESLLRLAHPMIPFITEAIWQKIKTIVGLSNHESIMTQPFPNPNNYTIDPQAFHDVEWIKKIITAIRTIKSNMRTSTNQAISILLRCESLTTEKKITDNLFIIKNITKLNNVTILSKQEKVPPSLSFIQKDIEIFLPINTLDKQNELTKLSKELTNLEKKIIISVHKLNNQSYITHAPKNIISKEQEKLKTYQNKKIKILKQQKLIMQS